MTKYVAVMHHDELGYGFFGKGEKRYVPNLVNNKKKFGSLKDFAAKYGYTREAMLKKSYWVADMGMKVLAVEVA